MNDPQNNQRMSNDPWIKARGGHPGAMQNSTQNEGSHRGYAFVNLRNPFHARLFLKIMSGIQVRSTSAKRLRICPAYIQGLNALRNHFRGKKIEQSSTSAPLFF
jgi:hypothetical protein